MRDRPLSSSSVKTFLQCVLKYYFHYEDKKPRLEDADHLAFGTALHAALERMHGIVSQTKQEPSLKIYDEVISVFMETGAKEGLKSLALYNEGRNILISRLDAVDPEEKVLGLELKFELKTPNGTPFTGSIDKLIEIDEDTVAVIDYKSSYLALTQEEIDEDIQLSMYDLAVSMLYPQYSTIVCALDYLRLSDVITHRTTEERYAFTQFLDAIYRTINNTTPEDIVPSLNRYCGYCDYKPFCPAHQKMVTDPAVVLPGLDSMDDDQFIDAWKIFEAAKKIYEARARNFKEEAYQRLDGRETVRGKELELYKIQQGRIYYDSRSIFNIVGPENFVNIASVGKGGIDKFLRDNPDYVEEIEEAANYGFNAPSFRIRKVKE